jgi:hypothetical protein
MVTASDSLAAVHVDVLLVPEALCGVGIGRRLMSRPENEAIRRGWGGAWLDTFSFQACRCHVATFPLQTGISARR